MKTCLAAAGAMLLLAGVTPARAHRLDEYLQATTISLEKERIQAQIRLIPGVAVLPMVLAGIDTDGDGIISTIEQRAYAERVLRDLSFTIDGNRMKPRLVSIRFPGMQAIQDGVGEIQLDFDMEVPPGAPSRRLVFENHHQDRIAAYLVNCLVPRDPDIRVTAQNRNYQQSFYQLDYALAGVRSGPLSLAWWSGGPGLLGAVAFCLFVRLAVLWRRGFFEARATVMR